jgi:hypothetical protein
MLHTTKEYFMATAKAAKKPGTELANWSEQLAKDAAVAAKLEESTSTSSFFSTKSGVLSFDGAPVPGNTMAVIVLDHVLETLYYEGKYDQDNPQGPVAFALGRDEKTMVWHENSREDYAGKLCSESDVCDWGSAETGRGKAAREVRRLMMIPAGTFENGRFKPFTKNDQIMDSAIAGLKIPVMSVKGFAGFVKQAAAALKRPPYGLFTKVSVVPDVQSQFKVIFEVLSEVPDDLMGSVLARKGECQDALTAPFAPWTEPEAPSAPKGRGAKAPAKAPAKKSKY